MVNRALRTAAVVSAIAALTGCNSLGVNFGDDKVQYETSTSRAPLEVPPDLNTVTNNDRFAVPTRPQIVSANAEAAKARMDAEARGDEPSQVLPETDYAKVVRDGQFRYVHVTVSPDRVWPLLPKDIIRATIGKALDVVYDTGTRDQYRARMERAEDGTTNIFITHRQMVEVLKGRQEESTIWQPGPSDPELEAVMLTRLAQMLETEFNPKAKPEEQKALEQMAAVKYAPMSRIEEGADGKPVAVVIDEPFDRAWRRVGVALDRGGFEVTDRDRSQGLFMINYLDPDYEQQKKSEQGFFANLFSSAKAVDPVPYRIRLSPDGEKTRVTVTGEDGRSDTTGVAPRILTLIGEQTR